MSLREYIWACDPIGSLLFIGSTTILLLAFDWAGGAYGWSDPHVAVPLILGLVMLVLFGLYGKFSCPYPRGIVRILTNMFQEWLARTDGLVAHVFFRSNTNFALSIFAFAVEGWIFYSAVNSITPQIIFNLGLESDAWSIAVRQLSYQIPTMVTSVPIVW
jgi:hypothetical protein